MIFQADPDQISRLDSMQLVQLMKRLLLAECRLLEIPLRAAVVPLQITVPDGGEDGRVEWTGGVDATDYLPARFCALQSKAQNLTEASIKAEVLKKPKKGRARLNDAIVEVLARRGAYLVFCSHAFTGQKIKRLRAAVTGAITKGRQDPSCAAAIEIYDANRIAGWVDTHPSVALWLFELQRRRSVAGFSSHESWAREADISGVPWVDEGVPRFVPADIVIPEDQRKDSKTNAWTFDQALQAALKFLAEDKVAVRIAGPSGFGKSRFAFELFNKRATPADQIEGTAVIYADLAIVGDEAARLALEIADAGSSTILVVDECPDETHRKLAAIARRVGSCLRLVTIDIETKVASTRDTLVLRLEPAPDEMIGAIAHAVAPKLQGSDLFFIRELARGFPQMAVLAAQRSAQGGQVIRSSEQLLDRIIWDGKQRSDDAQRALECLSLFEWVGVSGDVQGEGAAVAKLAGIPEATFIECIRSFKPRGVLIERGNYAQVTPIPVAAALGVQRLGVLPDDRLSAFFADAPDRLRAGLLRRLRWLDTAPPARAFARHLLAADQLGNFAALNTAFGADCLDRLVHVDPDLAMATIDRVFGGLTDEELLLLDAGRRHLVWALEKLVFREDSFDSAATLLLRLAASETERISNNATGQFKQLYQLLLSGTEAPPDARMRVLDEGLKSPNPREREVCVEALDHMLVAHHFSRSGGAEGIGSREPLKDWAPRSGQEVRNFFRAAVERLEAIAFGTDSLAPRAKQILGSHIRGLLSQLPLQEVKAMVSQIVARSGFWIEAVQGVNAWLYFDRTKAPKKIGEEIRNYFDELMPSDPVELVALYTHGWQTDFHDPNATYDSPQGGRPDYEYAARKAIELAGTIAANSLAIDRAIDRLLTGEAKTVFPFARRLAELAPEPGYLFKQALSKAESSSGVVNRSFFAGLIAGADARDQKLARECVRLALRSEKLKRDAVSLIGAGTLQQSDMQLVISLLRSHEIEPWQCAPLSYGRGMDHLEIKHVVPLLDELAQHDSGGVWTALEIAVMYLYGGKKPSKTMVKTLRQLLLSPSLFEGPVRGTKDGYDLETLVNALVRHKLVDTNLARALAKQLLHICSLQTTEVFFALGRSVRNALRALMAVHPGPVWTAVTGALRASDPLMRHQLEHLFEPEHNDDLGPGLLFALPAKLYLEWARKDPARRAHIVVRWLPIATKGEDGTLSWRSELEEFVAEFGGERDVLSAISMRLHPRSWWGSLVPHLEADLKLMKTWRNHARPEVRKWVHARIDALQVSIQDERRRDEEDVVRLA